MIILAYLPDHKSVELKYMGMSGAVPQFARRNNDIVTLGFMAGPEIKLTIGASYRSDLGVWTFWPAGEGKEPYIGYTPNVTIPQNGIKSWKDKL